jgi:Contractile injection system tube protein
MPTYPRGPRLLKGAIVIVNDVGLTPQTIALQYNPETVKRSLQPQTAGGDEGQRSQMVRYVGAPVETIELEVFLDAIDALEGNDAEALNAGIYPQLSLLETLVYPASQQVQQNDQLLAMGMLEIMPLAAPLTLFVWGSHRVLPVRLTSLVVSEEMFDPNLNPIQATLSLSMRALSYSDLAPNTKGYHLFMAYQQTKEALASQGRATGQNTRLGVNVNQL